MTMNERMHESLSALIDGEADELEIRRLLNQTEHDEQLLDKWASYQMIGAIMRQEAITEVDLAKGVRQALDGKPMDELNLGLSEHVAKHHGLWRKLTASGAIAASVMVAVLVGVQWQQTQVESAQVPMLAAEAPAAVSVATPEQLPAPVMAVAASVELSSAQQQELEQAQRRLQEYVLRHGEQEMRDAVQPMLPFMQTVRFQQDTEVRRK